jgi:hypothetical protein
MRSLERRRNGCSKTMVALEIVVQEEVLSYLHSKGEERRDQVGRGGRYLGTKLPDTCLIKEMAYLVPNSKSKYVVYYLWCLLWYS